MVNMQKSEKIGYDFSLEHARQQHNSEAEKELLALAPYPGDGGSMTFEKIGAQWKWQRATARRIMRFFSEDVVAQDRLKANYAMSC